MALRTLHAAIAAVLIVVAVGVFMFGLPQEVTGEIITDTTNQAEAEQAAAQDGAEVVEQPAEQQETAPAAQEPAPAAEESVPAEPVFVPVSNEPDLAVLSFDYTPLFPKTNEEIAFKAVIQNLGGQAMQLRKYKLVPFAESATEVSAAAAEKDILKPGETTEIKAIWQIHGTGPMTAAAGVDVFDEVAEYDETNNEMRISFRVQPLNGFAGCSGSKTAVCNSVLEVDPDYFTKHPSCTQITCENSPIVLCDEACPHPRG